MFTITTAYVYGTTWTVRIFWALNALFMHVIVVLLVVVVVTLRSTIFVQKMYSYKDARAKFRYETPDVKLQLNSLENTWC